MSWLAIGGGPARAHLAASTLLRLRDMEQISRFRTANLPFDGAVSFIPIDTGMENIGHTPAIHAHTYIWSFPVYPGHKDILAAERQSCSRSLLLTAGSVVFPGDRVPDNDLFKQGVAWADREVAAESEVIAGRREMQMQMYGCSVYQRSPNDRMHITAFFYQVARVIHAPGKADVTDYDLPINASLPKGDLHLIRMSGISPDIN